VTCYSWTLPSAVGATSSLSASETSLAAALRSAYGLDIWLDVMDGKKADRVVTPARDWKLVEGEEAVIQSLRRRLITNKGEWKTKPNYGCNARRYIKARATRANADELINEIRGQIGVDPRVQEVRAVTVEMTETLVRMAVSVRLRVFSSRARDTLVIAEVR
jgi:phage baseplate assembly protein W